MQSADNVKFGDRLAVSRGCGLESFLQRHGVGAGRVLLAPKSTQAAGRHADVGRIQVAVDVEIRRVPVHPLADMIGQPAYGQDVTRAIKDEGVVDREALPRKDLFVDRLKPSVVALKWMQTGHLVDDTARRGKRTQLEWGLLQYEHLLQIVTPKRGGIARGICCVATQIPRR